jgi:hypothetical protein
VVSEPLSCGLCEYMSCDHEELIAHLLTVIDNMTIKETTTPTETKPAVEAETAESPATSPSAMHTSLLEVEIQKAQKRVEELVKTAE